MNPSRSTLLTGALGAGISALLLTAMAFIRLPAGLEYPGLRVLTGRLVLSPAELSAYLAGMRLLFILDGFFLTGWLVAWVGLFHLLRSRAPFFGWLSLALGLVGALFDFGENSLVWGVMQNFQAGEPLDTGWVIGWQAIRHLSYWLPFLGALFAAPSLWRGRWLEKVAACVGSVLLIPAVAGLYFPNFSLIANLWFLLWFAAIGLLLWQSARENFPSPKEEGSHA